MLMMSFALFLTLHLFSQLAFISAEKVLTFPLLHEHAVISRALVEGENSSRKTASMEKLQTPHELLTVHQGYGAYYVDIFVGSPPQRQTVMLDTGSENVAIPCKGCEDCGNTHSDEHFDQTKSDSFHVLTCDQCMDGTCSSGNNTCTVKTSYVEGSSWVGNEVRDYVYPGGPAGIALDVEHPTSQSDDKYSGTNPLNAANYRFPLTFTCMTSNTGEFKKQKADGIMGLNMKKASFWKQMQKEGAISAKKFSLCMRKFPYVPLEPRKYSVGAMALGGVDSRLHHSEMQYMDFDPNDDRNLFSVKIRKIHVSPGGGSRLAGNNPDVFLSENNTILVEDDMKRINQFGMIVDSGTTDTILPAELKPEFDKAFEKIMGFPFPTKTVEVPVKELKEWPTIIFQMVGSAGNKGLGYDPKHPDDIFVAFPPSSYMRLDFGTTGSRYFPAMSMHNDYGVSILGSNFMRGHDILFDVDNYKIGVAESTCDYKLLMTGESEEEFMDPYPSREKVDASYRKNYTENLCEKNSTLCWMLWILNALPYLIAFILIITTVWDIFTYYGKNFVRQRRLELSLSYDNADTAKLMIKNSDDEDFCTQA